MLLVDLQCWIVRICKLFWHFTGFSKIMGTLSRIGFFNQEGHPLLKNEKRPTFRAFLFELLKISSEEPTGPLIGEKNIMERILSLGHCKEQGTALRTAKTIMYVSIPLYLFSNSIGRLTFWLWLGSYLLDFWDFMRKQRSLFRAKVLLMPSACVWRKGWPTPAQNRYIFLH